MLELFYIHSNSATVTIMYWAYYQSMMTLVAVFCTQHKTQNTAQRLYRAPKIIVEQDTTGGLWFYEWIKWACLTLFIQTAADVLPG